MIDSRFRPIFQKVCVVPVANYIKTTRTSPTTITIASLIAGILAAPFIIFGSAFFSIFFLALSRYLDNLDGCLARLTGENKVSGAILDIVSDRIVELAVILALYGYNPATRGLVSLIILGSMFLCVASFLIVGVFHKKPSDKSFFYSPGIIERTEAFIFFVLLILLPKAFTTIGIVFALLMLLTAGLRIWNFLKQAYYDEL